jgi:predicted MFS family arabinose efflux permease
MKNTWEFTLLWGLVIGIGTGFTSSVLGAVVVNRWFIKRKGLVMGILTASGATGQLVFLPLLAKLATEHSWQLPVLVTSLASLLVVLIVFVFMRERPSDVGVLPYGAIEAVELSQVGSGLKGNPFSAALNGLRTGMRVKEFWLLAGSFFVCGLSTNGLIGTHLIPACGEHGIPEVTAASLLAFMGIFDIIGTTLSGWLSDRWDSRWLLFWYYGLRGLSLLFLPAALDSGSMWSLTVFAVFYGLDWVATVPPTVRLCNSIFGEKNGIVFGWVWASHQLGAAVAAFGGGTIREITGSYTFIFITAGILCAVASAFVVQIRRGRGEEVSVAG